MPINHNTPEIIGRLSQRLAISPIKAQVLVVLGDSTTRLTAAQVAEQIDADVDLVRDALSGAVRRELAVVTRSLPPQFSLTTGAADAILAASKDVSFIDASPEDVDFQYYCLLRACGSIYHDPDELAEEEGDEAPFDDQVTPQEASSPTVKNWLDAHHCQILWSLR